MMGLSVENRESFNDESSYNKGVVRLNNSDNNLGAIGSRGLFSFKSK